jgi:H/ACA ribonucleoprotein complex subunit 4
MTARSKSSPDLARWDGLSGEEFARLDYKSFLNESLHSEKNSQLVVLRAQPQEIKSGSEPSKRELKEYLKYGFIPLDKPQVPTSHEVVAWVRKITGSEKAGHSGTLDPMVSGVLPIALDSGTKALSVLLLGPKEYLAVARIHDSVPAKKIEDALAAFRGPIFQKPPQKSSVRRSTRTRNIYALDTLEQKGNLLLLRVLCEAGTYVRKLIYDFGEVLQVGATMVELRRTRVCQITESDLVTLHQVHEAFAVLKDTGDESQVRKIVIPIEESVNFLKIVKIMDSAVDSICHGAQLAIPGIVALSPGIRTGDPVQLLTGKGELVAIAEAKMTSEQMSADSKGIAAITRRVVMDPGTYPKMWKTKEKSEVLQAGFANAKTPQNKTEVASALK